MLQRLGGLLRPHNTNNNKGGNSNGGSFDDLRTAGPEGDENELDMEFGAIPKMSSQRTKPSRDNNSTNTSTRSNKNNTDDAGVRLSGTSEKKSTVAEKRAPLQPRAVAENGQSVPSSSKDSSSSSTNISSSTTSTTTASGKAERPRNQVTLTPLLRRRSEGDMDLSPSAALLAAAFASTSPATPMTPTPSQQQQGVGEGASVAGLALELERLMAVSPPGDEPLDLTPRPSPQSPVSPPPPAKGLVFNTTTPPSASSNTPDAKGVSPGYVRPPYDAKAAAHNYYPRYSHDDSGAPGLISPADFRFKSGRMRGGSNSGTSPKDDIYHYAAKNNFMASPKKPTSLQSHPEPDFALSPQRTGARARQDRKQQQYYNYQQQEQRQYKGEGGEDDQYSGEEGMDREALFSRIRHNRIDSVLETLRRGCDPNIRDENGNTMLHVCAQNNHRKLARECIRFGCDVNAINKRGLTPLDCSDRLQFVKMSEYLVIEGGENAFGSSVVRASLSPAAGKRGSNSSSDATATTGSGAKNESSGSSNFYTTRGMR